jgi:uncharacterized membrane protein YedE/YeeE
MQPAFPFLLSTGFLLLGLALGAVLQRSHFCTMGCVSDAALFGSLRRLRVWALAVTVALVGTQALQIAELVDLSASAYLRGGWPLVLALPGGLLFGLGMVQSGGCISRNLVRLGSGSLKAGTALLAATAAALATAAVLPDAAASDAVGTPGTPVVGLALAAGLLLFCLGHAGFRRSPADLATGLLLGVLVTLGWLATAMAGTSPDSLNYLAFDRPDLLVPLVAGTIAGALVIARARGEFRLERFTAAGDLRRHLVGGVLMGMGGSLALGCTIGEGLTGVSTLSLASFLALAGMLAGGWWGVKQLETGRVLPWLPDIAWRQQ